MFVHASAPHAWNLESAHQANLGGNQIQKTNKCYLACLCACRTERNYSCAQTKKAQGTIKCQLDDIDGLSASDLQWRWFIWCEALRNHWSTSNTCRRWLGTLSLRNHCQGPPTFLGPSCGSCFQFWGSPSGQSDPIPAMLRNPQHPSGVCKDHLHVYQWAKMLCLLLESW